MLSFIPCLAGQSFAAEESTVLEQVYGDKSAEEKIADAIEALRGYYLNGDDDFTHLVSLAYHFISDKLENDLHIIQQRFKVNENRSRQDTMGFKIKSIPSGYIFSLSVSY